MREIRARDAALRGAACCAATTEEHRRESLLTTPRAYAASHALATPQHNSTIRRIAMKRSMFAFVIAVICASTTVTPARSQGPNTDVKFIADTLVVQAEGSYESDPDVATLTFIISAQDKELKQTYDRASESMRRIAALAE